jgi:UMF1 family MFS transporter
MASRIDPEFSPTAAPKDRPGGWLGALGLDRPELRAWAMYDWANSAMVTTIIAAVFPIFFANFAAAGLPAARATEYFATASTVGMVIVAFLSPVLGTIADTRPVKKRLLAWFLGLGVGAVGAMFFIQKGQWAFAAALFVLANIGANGSFVFYDALLPHVARPDEVDRVSTAGYALGYLGGGILLVLNLLWIQKPGWFGLPSGPGLTPSEASLPARLAFVSVAVWWLVFSVPLFRTVPEPKAGPEAGDAEPADGPPRFHPLADAFARLAGTFRELRRYRQGFLMLLAFLIYNDGIGTIFRMATTYGASIGIDAGAMIGALVLVQFVGIPFAFGFGALAGRVGAKRSIVLGLVVYVGISVLGYFMKTATHFYLLALLVGMVQGGTQALSRSLFASLIPRDRSGEFFGFFAVTEKFAGIFGPALFALSVRLAGDTRHALLSVIPFFVVGVGLLGLVDVEAGQREARAVESEDAGRQAERVEALG